MAETGSFRMKNHHEIACADLLLTVLLESIITPGFFFSGFLVPVDGVQFLSAHIQERPAAAVNLAVQTVCRQTGQILKS